MQLNKLLEEVEKKVNDLKNNRGGNIQEQLQALTKYIHQNTDEEQKEQLREYTLGYGKEDFQGSTKLGPGTGIILQAALGQGTESGSIPANRMLELNYEIENNFASFQTDIVGTINAARNQLMLEPEEQQAQSYSSPFDMNMGPPKPGQRN